MAFLNFPKWVLFFLLFCCQLKAILVGNPEQPDIQSMGIIRSAPSNWNIRIGYFGDYTYKQQFKDEFRIGDAVETPSYLKLWTQAALLTLNFRERIDFYGIIGGSKVQIDDDVFMNQQLAWGIGSKLIIIHEGPFRIGLDVKYFQSNQKPLYFLSDHLAYNLVSDFHFVYREIQAAMGVSYRTTYLSPYAHATYLISKIDPQPLISLVRLPQMDYSVDVVSKSVVGTRRWGMAIGATLIDKKTATLAVEWRLFNQNSVSLTGEIRF